MSERFWYNYETEQYELRPAPTSDDEAVRMIPQSQPAQILYLLYRETGKTVIEAMRDVLLLSIGEQPDDGRPRS